MIKESAIITLLRVILPNSFGELTFFLIVLLLSLTYYRFIWKDARLYKKMNELPGPPLKPLVGNAFDFMIPSTEYLSFVHSLIEKYGRVVRIWMLNTPYVMLASAKEFEKVLASHDHVDKSPDYFAHKPWLGNALNLVKKEQWLPRRRQLNPSFQFRFLNDFMEVFNEQSLVMRKLFQKEIVDKGAVDVFPYCCRATFDIICESAMGTKVEAQTKKEVPYLSNIISLSRLLVERMLRPWYHPTALWKLSFPGRRAYKHTNNLISFTEDLIAKRRKLFNEQKVINNNAGDEDDDDIGASKKPRLAFLDLLLQMQESHGKKFLSDTELRNETDLFMVAGHETSGSTLAWTLFLLASHPEVQEKIFQELDEVFQGDRDRPVTIPDLGNLVYLDRCMKESLRICPPIPVIFRQIHKDIQLEKGKVIPKGASIALNILELQRDPTVFPEPMKFDPERFAPENTAGRSPYAFVPFAAGPRNCIGIRFAQMEGKVILATLLRNFRLETDLKFQELEISPDISLRPRNGLPIRIFPR